MENLKTLVPSFLVAWCITLVSFSMTYAIDPKREYAATPEAIGLSFEEVKIPIDDVSTLNAWVCLQADREQPFIIISNTDAGNMANSLGQAKALYDAGYTIVMYDYRGFGASSDFDINPNMLYYNEFSEDLQKTIQHVKTNYKPVSIILYGLSMGTLVSRMNINFDPIIKGAILDSFVIDPQAVVERIHAMNGKGVLLPEHAAEYSKSQNINVDKPVLIFSGLQDVMTKTSDYSAFLSVNTKAEMITWDCNHLECFYTMGEDSSIYIAAIDSFIDAL